MEGRFSATALLVSDQLPRRFAGVNNREKEGVMFHVPCTGVANL